MSTNHVSVHNDGCRVDVSMLCERYLDSSLEFTGDIDIYLDCHFLFDKTHMTLSVIKLVFIRKALQALPNAMLHTGVVAKLKT